MVSTVSPRILVTGVDGQVGSAIASVARNAGFAVLPMRRADLDLAEETSILGALNEAQPDVIVNCAAYTAVDKAETEPDIAFSINAVAPGIMARWCADNDCRLIHLSTDYVFSGSGRHPYRENDPLGPINAYGESKAEGERRVREACGAHVILRSAWIYAAEGKNFVRTMLRLGAERAQLDVVADQRGCPTAAHNLAEALCHVIRRLALDDTAVFGTYHYVDAGETTWYDFAQRIFAGASEYWEHRPRVVPITTDQFPALAARPRYSVLDTSKFRKTFSVEPPFWQISLDRVLKEYFGRRLLSA